MIYGPGELTRELARLKTMPPDQFTTEISGEGAEPPVQLEFAGLSDRARRG
jgi:hypothetical protein